MHNNLSKQIPICQNVWFYSYDKDIFPMSMVSGMYCDFIIILWSNQNAKADHVWSFAKVGRDYWIQYKAEITFW